MAVLFRVLVEGIEGISLSSIFLGVGPKTETTYWSVLLVVFVWVVKNEGEHMHE